MEASDTKYNPWSTDDSGAWLRNALLLAERTGHIFRREEPEESVARQRLADTPSLKMIQLQREISQHCNRLNEVNSEIQKRVLYHETKDILDINFMEGRTKELKVFSEHLQTVVSNKEVIINRLQQPFVGDFVKIEAAFHRYASELFTHLAPILSDLTSHLDDLTWVNSSGVNPGQLDTLVTDLSGALASIQTNYQSISQMSQCIHSLYSQDSSQRSVTSDSTTP
ncbi:uncharacterized protein [Littorina saxatilis]|uniref:HAUS augmin-like complex subunit 2 n=1 Tax=Littorina saxatilis TaxID=31220 RepID=A0AAN9GNM4_9CAEN